MAEPTSSSSGHVGREVPTYWAVGRELREVIAMDAQWETSMSTTPARLAGRYVLGEPLGRGRSTVYRATDTRLERRVAVKQVELLAGQEDVDRVRSRALREAQAAARLNNPCVVTETSSRRRARSGS
jgi:hypothetical protein